MSRIFGDELEPHLSKLFDEYVRIEAEIEAEPYRNYKDVLAEVVRRLGKSFGVVLSPDKATQLAADLPRWSPFDDTVNALRQLKERFRLGILSNVDRDLFQGTAARLIVPFDFVITAEDVQSYKPQMGHFDCLLRDHANEANVIHVAQSLYHDGGPANELGIAFVWINRYNEVNHSSVRMHGAFPTLAAFADAVCD